MHQVRLKDDSSRMSSSELISLIVAHYTGSIVGKMLFALNDKTQEECVDVVEDE